MTNTNINFGTFLSRPNPNYTGLVGTGFGNAASLGGSAANASKGVWGGFFDRTATTTKWGTDAAGKVTSETASTFAPGSYSDALGAIGAGVGLALQAGQLFSSWKLGKGQLKALDKQYNLAKEQFDTENRRYEQRQADEKAFFDNTNNLAKAGFDAVEKKKQEAEQAAANEAMPTERH